MGVEVADAPAAVRLAGAAVVLEGAGVLAACVAFLAAGVGFGVWGFLALLGLAVVALGVALLLGRRGARPPAVVLQMLTLGVAFYAAVPSSRPEWGVPAALVAAAILAGLLCAPARVWAVE